MQERSSKAKVPVGLETVREGDGGGFRIGSGKLREDREEGVELKRSKLGGVKPNVGSQDLPLVQFQSVGYVGFQLPNGLKANKL